LALAALSSLWATAVALRRAAALVRLRRATSALRASWWQEAPAASSVRRQVSWLWRPPVADRVYWALGLVPAAAASLSAPR
jgi:hypothetical protein